MAPGTFAGDRAWNIECEAAASRGEGEWTLEAAIPFAALAEHAPRAGEEWRVNFRRKEIEKGSTADWQVPIDYNPGDVGISFQ